MLKLVYFHVNLGTSTYLLSASEHIRAHVPPYVTVAF